MHWFFTLLDVVASKKFECPICKYTGTFRSVAPSTGRRKHAKCPRCGAFERHRLQFLVLESIFAQEKPDNMRALHFAPEPFIGDYLAEKVQGYHTVDLNRKDVDCVTDLQALPFGNRCCDLVYASHVLEHVSNDVLAVAEIYRIMKPGGLAILPVPVVVHETIEYPMANPYETCHVRAPGFDYFERYQRVFNNVKLYKSTDFPERYQTFVYENRRDFPSTTIPLRTPMAGERHVDIVPVCRA